MTQRELIPAARAAAPMGGAQPRTAFELPIYADATLAGLAALVPVPLLDWWLEERFRRRMVTQIAAHRGLRLSAAARQALDIGGGGLIAAGLRFLLKLPLRLVLRLVRKLVYVLAIKEATEKVSYYWQRAFLIDYMLRAGHLEDAASAGRAQRAMQEAMRGLPSPLIGLAGQLARRVWELRPFRRSSSEAGLAAAAAEQRGFIERQWAGYEGFLLQLAERYDRAYAAPGR